MTAQQDEIAAELCKLLERYNKKGLQLKGATNLTSELDIDSVEVMNVVMEVEDKFNVDVPINLLGDVETVEDLADVVKTRMKGQ